jgi:hypothetical protein
VTPVVEMDDMETACERICAIIDTLSEPDQFAVVHRLVTIAAMKAEDTEDYLLWLPDIVMEDIKAHLRAKHAVSRSEA